MDRERFEFSASSHTSVFFTDDVEVSHFTGKSGRPGHLAATNNAMSLSLTASPPAARRIAEAVTAWADALEAYEDQSEAEGEGSMW
jgi:hypothetical protein